MPHPGGRPTEYSDEILKLANEYIDSCIDDDKQRLVKIPTVGGLAVHLDLSRETLYAWKNAKNEDKSQKYPEFSDIMEKLGALQEDRLINKGLSGQYNPTITKVLLTKHGYREGIDNTTNEKDLPIPILGGTSNVHTNNSDKKDPGTA